MTNEKGQRAAFTYFGKGPRENKSSFGQPTNQWSIYSSLIGGRKKYHITLLLFWKNKLSFITVILVWPNSLAP